MTLYLVAVWSACTFGLAIYIAIHLPRLLTNQGLTMAALSDVLTAVAAVDASVDAVAARVAALPGAEDLQPAVDALTAVKAKLDAIVPATPAV